MYNPQVCIALFLFIYIVIFIKKCHIVLMEEVSRQEHKNTKITIFGLAGTGKTTSGKMVAEALGYEYMSTGQIFRDFASELGLTLSEFETLANTTDEYDKKTDARSSEYGQTHNNFVFESRLAWHFIPDSFKVALACEFDTRIGRIASREKKDIDQAKEETKHREDLIHKRYEKYYGITDLENPKNFDLVVDTKTNNAVRVAEIIVEEYKKWLAN